MDAMGRNGLTALHVAACSDRTLPLLEHLLGNDGLDVRILSQDGHQCGETAGGRTALHLAATYGAARAANLLLQEWRGAAAKRDWDDVLPARAAWLNGHTELSVRLAEAAVQAVGAADEHDGLWHDEEEAEEVRVLVEETRATVLAGACQSSEADLQKSLRSMGHVERERERLSLAGRPRLLAAHLVRRCFSPEECQWLLGEVRAAASHHGWQHARHKHYATEDLPLWRAPHAQAWILEQFRTRIAPLFARAFGVSQDVLRLQECFGVRYEPSGQAELRVHRDGTMFSFNVLLNESDGFEGGGTVFNTPVTLVDWDNGGKAMLERQPPAVNMPMDDTRDAAGGDGDGAWERLIVRQRTSEAHRVQGDIGDCLMHCGQLLHGAGTVVEGTRCILVGFVAEKWDAEM